MNALSKYKSSKPSSKEEFDETIEKLIENGVNRQELETLIDFICSPNKVKTSSIIAVIRDYLYPTCPVSNNSVIKIMGCLSNNNVAIQIKSRILKWLVVVYDYLEDTRIVNQFYDVLFAQLKFEMTRQWVCHLLFLSTTKDLVKSWRVRYLLDLYHNNKENSHMLALLMLYKKMAPTLVLESLPPRPRAGVFNHPDPTALEKLRRLQGQVDEHSEMNYKKTKTGIPTVKSLGGSGRGGAGAGAETIRSFNEFTNKIHKLEFPLQMGSVLNDGTGMLTKLVRYKGDDLAYERLNTWLEHSIDDDILKSVYTFTQQSKVFPEQAQVYVFKRLNGYSNSNLDGDMQVIFDSFEFLNECESSELTNSLKKIIEINDSIRLQCIKSLGKLPWHDNEIEKFVISLSTTELEKKNSKSRLTAEHIVLEYYETMNKNGAGAAQIPPRGVAQLLSQSTLPSSLIRLNKLDSSSCKIDPESPHLLLKSMNLINQLKNDRDFSYNLKEPVNAASLSSTPLTTQEYTQLFIQKLYDPTSLLL